MKNRTKKKPKRIMSPLRIDPTRTTTLRRYLVTELDKKFRKLNLEIHNLIIEEDAFGLVPSTPTTNGLTTNRWKFKSTVEKLNSFTDWLRGKFGNFADSVLWRKYATEGYKRGAGRSFDDAKAPLKATLGLDEKKLTWYRGTKEQFLRDVFTSPVATERLQILASRAYTDLENVTEDMAVRMSRVLTDGLARGANPNEIAELLTKELNLSKERARTIARTEVIRAHSEGQLDALEKLGISDVGVMVEWSTAKDKRVCPKCKPLNGVTLPVSKARGLIPRHPNCRCAWIPAIGSKETPKKKVEMLTKNEEEDWVEKATRWLEQNRGFNGS